MEPTNKSIGDLVGDSVEHAREIVKTEIQLAKVELSAQAQTAARGAALGAAGGMFAIFGVNFLLWALLMGLAPEMPNWMASLIVAAIVLVVGGVLAMAAKSTLDSVDPNPVRAKRQLEENIEWAKRQPS